MADQIVKRPVTEKAHSGITVEQSNKESGLKYGVYRCVRARRKK